MLPHLLPDDWKGGFVLLAGVFVMSAFLDNIAAAMIGGTMAKVLFRRKVHIGYLAAIVAASQRRRRRQRRRRHDDDDDLDRRRQPAGRARGLCRRCWSRCAIFGVIAASSSTPTSRSSATTRRGQVEFGRLAVVVAILAAAISANVWFNLTIPPYSTAFR